MRSTRSIHLILAGVVAALMLVPTQAQAATQPLPGGAQPLGQSMSQWQQAYMQWVLGDSDGPVFTDTTCTASGGVTLVTPPTSDSGVRHCDVRRGSPIVVTPAISWSWIPTWGSNDAEIMADAAWTFDLLDDSNATLDGRALRLGDGFASGAFDLHVEEGSFWDLANDGTPDEAEAGDVIRVATHGQLAVIPPLKPGIHELQLEASFDGGQGYFNQTMVLHVG
jgi:hypothetical protein